MPIWDDRKPKKPKDNALNRNCLAVFLMMAGVATAGIAEIIAHVHG